MSLACLRRMYPSVRALQPHLFQSTCGPPSSHVSLLPANYDNSSGHLQYNQFIEPDPLRGSQFSYFTKAGNYGEMFLLCNQNETQDTENLSPKQSDKPSEEVLEAVAKNLVRILERFFIEKTTEHQIYRKDIIFENRISGETIIGWPQYHIRLSLLKILAHLKFIQVRFHVHGYSINNQDGCIRLRWSIRGMGLFRFVVDFFPKKLYRPLNAIEHAKVWREGISYYYLDGKGLIYRHVLENKEEDKERAGGLREELKKKVMRLAQKPSNPAPI